MKGVVGCVSLVVQRPLGGFAGGSRLRSLLPYMAMAAASPEHTRPLSAGPERQRTPPSVQSVWRQGRQRLDECQMWPCFSTAHVTEPSPLYSFSFWYRKWMRKSPPSLLTMDLVCAKLALQEMMLLVLSSPQLSDAPDIRYCLNVYLKRSRNTLCDIDSLILCLCFRVWWSVWARKTAMLVMKHRAKEESWRWSIPLSMVLSPTGMTWRRSGITPSTMSWELPQRSTQSCWLRPPWTPRPTGKRWLR